MSRFNNIKTSFFDKEKGNIENKLKNSIPREVRARVSDLYKSQDPNNKNLYFIKASIISVRPENQLTIEPTVKGSGNQVPRQEFLLNEMTNITVIPMNDDLQLPNPGDEIVVDIVTSEVTKELNIDGYYKRVIKSEGVFTKNVNDVVEKIKEAFNKRNSLSQSDFELPPLTPVSPDQKDYNPQVLQLARSISGYTYRQGGSGVPFENLTIKNNIILNKDEFVYCSGFTFYVCFTTAKQAGLFEDKTISQIRKFQNDWYGNTGETNLLSGFALSSLGIGINVSWADAKPGDFCQLWRTDSIASGHSVIFLNWIYDNNNNKIGITYRSSQTSTGVANNTEYLFGKNPKNPNSKFAINPSRLFFSRLIVK